MHKNQTFTLSLPPTVNIVKRIYKGCVPMHTTSKRIELESPGCTGFEENLKCFQTLPETFQLNSFKSYVSVNTSAAFFCEARSILF